MSSQAPSQPGRSGRRRGPRWESLGRGVARAADVPGGERGAFLAELRAWQEVLPDAAVFDHLTAARVHGLWLPPVPAGLPLFVAVPVSTPRPRRPQLVVTRHTVPPDSVEVDGVRVTTVPATLLACARDLGLLDLVVLIDAALHLGRATREQLQAVSRLRRRGARQLTEALTVADGRSESPWESVLRMFHLAVGAEVEPQVTIRDSAGGFVARVDLLLVGTSDAHEYDGADHRNASRHRSDLRRERALLENGCVRRGYSADDLRWSASAMLRDIDHALGRDHDLARLESWRRLWDASLFSPAGTRRATERWHPDPLGEAC